MRYLFATNNPGKVKEIRHIFESAGLEFISLADLGLAFTPEETGTTFKINAIQKVTKTAEYLHAQGVKSDIAILSDDSGLCIDALSGLPGVDSATFMGADTPYNERNEHIIEMLSDVPKTQRIARYLCVIACLLPDGTIETTSGEVEGLITSEPKGDKGFGYDPIFFSPIYGKTMAELEDNDKNIISHRGKALRDMIQLLKTKELIK